MLRKCCVLFNPDIVRFVDPNGFVGDYKNMRHVNAPKTLEKVQATLKNKANHLFCGHANTGKLTLLKSIGQALEEKGQSVAYVSAENSRANRLDGLLLYHFIGMRITRDELPSRDQLEGTLERHARLVESTYGGMYPSLSTVDVLVLDSIQNIHPTVFLSMESVARRLRGKPNLPFGGLRVYGAADFWRLPVHPTSDTGGYLFQLDQWSEWFPKQQLLRKTFGQEKTLNEMTEKALFGTLTLDDMIEMERRSFEGKPEASLFSYSTSLARKTATTNTADTDDVKSWFTHGKEKRADTPLISLLNDDMVSNVTAISKYTPRFPKQPTVRVMPTRFKALKQVEVGNYLVNVIIQSSLPVSFGLVNSLSVDVGDHVHLLLNSDQNAFGIAAGSVGEVMKIEEHFLTVHFIEEQKTVELPRMRVVTYHRKYPEVMYEVQQFPVFPRKRLCPLNIVNYRNCYKVNINCRRVADTNDLGNMLANMRTYKDFTIRNTSDIVFLDGMVHEPTRIYYYQIQNLPLSDAPEQWCRNCKSFVPSDTFFQHWSDCVKSVRWCFECSKTIPLDVLEPHKEKHQVVLCMDCGQGVEWRQWEAHRLSCGPMMREVSADNEFLPLRTRQLALELGLDKRDLHTMRKFSKSMLPKSKLS